MLIFIVYVCTVRRWYLKCDYTTTSLCAMSSVKAWHQAGALHGWLHYHPLHHQVTHSLMKKVNRIEPSTTLPMQCIRKHTYTWYPFNSGCIEHCEHLYTTTFAAPQQDETDWLSATIAMNAFTTSSLSTTAEDPRRWPLWAWRTLIIKDKYVQYIHYMDIEAADSKPLIMQ